MKLKEVSHQHDNGVDTYDIKISRPLSTLEYKIWVDFKNKTICADYVGYGIFHKVETKEEFRELENILIAKGKLNKPFSHLKIV